MFLNLPEIHQLKIQIENNVYSKSVNCDQIFPSRNLIYKAFSDHLVEPKIVIIGQDPYHNFGQAMGLSFSVPLGVKLPPSLKNIYKEIENQLKIKMNYTKGDLTFWQQQGVILLNSVLTVSHNSPGSHRKYGWELLTDKYIKYLSDTYSEIVFLLWGSYAISKVYHIDSTKHLILTSSHPSPFSYYKGFQNNNHFIISNNYLISKNKEPINWQIT